MSGLPSPFTSPALTAVFDLVGLSRRFDEALVGLSRTPNEPLDGLSRRVLTSQEVLPRLVSFVLHRGGASSLAARRVWRSGSRGGLCRRFLCTSGLLGHCSNREIRQSYNQNSGLHCLLSFVMESVVHRSFRLKPETRDSPTPSYLRRCCVPQQVTKVSRVRGSSKLRFAGLLGWPHSHFWNAKKVPSETRPWNHP